MKSKTAHLACFGLRTDVFERPEMVVSLQQKNDPETSMITTCLLAPRWRYVKLLSSILQLSFQVFIARQQPA